jgi:branched-chain amino acid transport system substrate-binding protein
VAPKTFPRTWAAALIALVVLVAGCGDSAPPEDQRAIHGERLTVYASAPLHGPDAAAGRAILQAQRLALAQDGGRVGRYAVRLVTLDAARPFTAGADPAKVSENARRAASDARAVAYLGEVRVGASAISIPILNEAGMLQVSPLDTALGLTTRSAAITGSPERYYPNAARVGRTFARLVSSDDAQAEALAAYMARERVRRLVVLTDDDAAGLALAGAMRAAARPYGIVTLPAEPVDPHAKEHRDLVAAVVDYAPDAVLYAGGRRDVAARVWRELARADASLKLFAPSELGDAAFARRLGAWGGTAYATQPLLPLDVDRGAAQGFARAYLAAYGEAPPAEALYGFESMRAVLAAIRRAERTADEREVSRRDVVRAFFAAGAHDGVLGTYRIDVHGDTSLWRWGAFRLEDGASRFVAPLARGVVVGG